MQISHAICDCCDNCDSVREEGVIIFGEDLEFLAFFGFVVKFKILVSGNYEISDGLLGEYKINALEG